MKFTKSGLLSLSLLFTVLGLWIMTVSMAAERQLYIDMNNASQYMGTVKFISTWSDNSASLNSQTNNNSIKIQTTNFILTKTWADEENIISGGLYSSILWWEHNNIKWTWTYDNISVILWWENNTINGILNVILWWESNKIEDWKQQSVILWWKSNIIKWNKSVVLWSYNAIKDGTWSIVIWTYWSVSGNYSVALWKRSHVEANNSFLWNDDGVTAETLAEDNVFVIMSKKGMVINTSKAHNFAKLTLWWPLIISSKDTDDNIQCGWWNGWWILKIVNSEDQMCLCSCDGSWRNSMVGKGRCMGICDSRIIKPECGGTDVKRVCDSSNHKISFSWSCSVWEVAKWEWAYFIDKNEKVHWSCQTVDGSTVGCSGTVSNAGDVLEWCADINYTCRWEIPANSVFVEWSDRNLTKHTERTLYPSREEASEHKCAYFCNELEHYHYDSDIKSCIAWRDPCLKSNPRCESPFERTNRKYENHKYTWSCKLWEDEWECFPACEPWYKLENDICVKIACNHCASSWFPYCFTINFKSSCTEDYWQN